MGESAGLVFLYVGGVVRFCGKVLPAAVIAACTSCAAASILRLRSNCTTTWVEPSVLIEVIWVTPAIWPNWRSSGAATEDAMVSALAPANVAVTWMVGKSTWGRGATGRNGKAVIPTNAKAVIKRVVAIGRWMNGWERFTSCSVRRQQQL